MSSLHRASAFGSVTAAACAASAACTLLLTLLLTVPLGAQAGPPAPESIGGRTLPVILIQAGSPGPRLGLPSLGLGPELRRRHPLQRAGRGFLRTPGGIELQLGAWPLLPDPQPNAEPGQAAGKREAGRSEGGAGPRSGGAGGAGGGLRGGLAERAATGRPQGGVGEVVNFARLRILQPGAPALYVDGQGRLCAGGKALTPAAPRGFALRFADGSELRVIPGRGSAFERIELIDPGWPLERAAKPRNRQDRRDPRSSRADGDGEARRRSGARSGEGEADAGASQAGGDGEARRRSGAHGGGGEAGARARRDAVARPRAHELFVRGQLSQRERRVVAFAGPRYYWCDDGRAIVSLSLFGPWLWVKPVVAHSGADRRTRLHFVADLWRAAGFALADAMPERSAQYPVSRQQVAVVAEATAKVLPVGRASTRSYAASMGQPLVLPLGDGLRAQLLRIEGNCDFVTRLRVHPDAPETFELLHAWRNETLHRVLPPRRQTRGRYVGRGLDFDGFAKQRLPWSRPLDGAEQRRDARAAIQEWLPGPGRGE
jgi:hypothetical protein